MTSPPEIVADMTADMAEEISRARSRREASEILVSRGPQIVSMGLAAALLAPSVAEASRASGATEADLARLSQSTDRFAARVSEVFSQVLDAAAWLAANPEPPPDQTPRIGQQGGEP